MGGRKSDGILRTVGMKSGWGGRVEEGMVKKWESEVSVARCLLRLLRLIASLVSLMDA